MQINDALVAKLIHFASKLNFWAPYESTQYNREDHAGVIVDPDTIKIRHNGREYKFEYEATIMLKDGKYTHLHLSPSVDNVTSTKSVQ